MRIDSNLMGAVGRSTAGLLSSVEGGVGGGGSAFSMVNQGLARITAGGRSRWPNNIGGTDRNVLIFFGLVAAFFVAMAAIGKWDGKIGGR